MLGEGGGNCEGEKGRGGEREKLKRLKRLKKLKGLKGLKWLKGLKGLKGKRRTQDSRLKEEVENQASAEICGFPSAKLCEK